LIDRKLAIIKAEKEKETKEPNLLSL